MARAVVADPALAQRLAATLLSWLADFVGASAREKLAVSVPTDWGHDGPGVVHRLASLCAVLFHAASQASRPLTSPLIPSRRRQVDPSPPSTKTPHPLPHPSVSHSSALPRFDSPSPTPRRRSSKRAENVATSSHQRLAFTRTGRAAHSCASLPPRTPGAASRAHRLMKRWRLSSQSEACIPVLHHAPVGSGHTMRVDTMRVARGFRDCFPLERREKRLRNDRRVACK